MNVAAKWDMCCIQLEQKENTNTNDLKPLDLVIFNPLQSVTDFSLTQQKCLYLPM